MARRKIAEDAAFHEGDVVAVFNQTLSGCPILEGMATIVGPGDAEDQYKVKFSSDQTRCLRFVYSDGQDDPEGYVRKMRTDLAVSSSAEAA